MSDNKPPLCSFDIAWVGRCKSVAACTREEAESGEEQFCEKHKGLKCCVCGAQANRECPDTLGPLVCGALLCKNCMTVNDYGTGSYYSGHRHERINPQNKDADETTPDMVENRTAHKCSVVALNRLAIPDPDFGDMKLNVYPFEWTGEPVKLPASFKLWEDTLNKVMERVPLVDGCNKHYVTIDSKFFTVDDFLRREGVHMDGNFCADPTFSRPTWGGTRVGWGGVSVLEDQRIYTPWVSPYNIEIPYGTYVSDTLGGLLCVSSALGCRAWHGTFYGEVGDEGDYSEMLPQLTQENEVMFEANRLYFMTSNTPHESLEIKKGTRRTFLRVTLNHNYPNEMLKVS